MEKQLTDDLMNILEVILEKGGTDCSGTCHHRKPGEFHCHTFAAMLKISSMGVKNRILKLLRMGLLERHRIEHKDVSPLVRFMVSEAGKAVLAKKGQLRK